MRKIGDSKGIERTTTIWSEPFFFFLLRFDKWRKKKKHIRSVLAVLDLFLCCIIFGID